MASKELMKRILEVVYEESDRGTQEGILDAFIFVFVVVMINESISIEDALKRLRSTHVRVSAIWNKLNVMEWL